MGPIVNPESGLTQLSGLTILFSLLPIRGHLLDLNKILLKSRSHHSSGIRGFMHTGGRGAEAGWS